jgi:hypothetical protein
MHPQGGEVHISGCTQPLTVSAREQISLVVPPSSLPVPTSVFIALRFDFPVETFIARIKRSLFWSWRHFTYYLICLPSLSVR